MKRAGIFLLFAFAFSSCSGPWFGDDGLKKPEYSVAHDMIVLGDRLENPYAVENVTRALNNVYPTRAGRMAVNPTDMYVRFLPKNESEYDRLSDIGLVLSDHPLDYEIIRDGDYYHDPDLPDDRITWQYAVVKKDFVPPAGIEYEVIQDCFIPSDVPTRADDGIDWDLVEAEAFRVTGNAGMLSPRTRDGEGPQTPSGRIAIVDDRIDGGEPHGVAGVKVMCHTFVKFSSCYTDVDGNYMMDKSFSGQLRYRLVFQNEKGFAIGFNKILVPASTSTLGKGGPEGVSVVIDNESDRKMFCRAVVNNAGYEYYEKCSEQGKEISLPPLNTRIWIFQGLSGGSTLMLQHGVMIDDTLIGNYLGVYSKIAKTFLPDITLGLKEYDDYASVYSQAVHELAHASHFSQVGTTYWDKFVLFIMTSYFESGGRVYGLGDEKDAGYCEVGEMWAYYLMNCMYNERYHREDMLFGLSFWFHPHIFHYLDERGLGRTKIFAALTSDVCSRMDLQKKLESLYSDDAMVIKQAFDRYSYEQN